MESAAASLRDGAAALKRSRFWQGRGHRLAQVERALDSLAASQSGGTHPFAAAAELTRSLAAAVAPKFRIKVYRGALAALADNPQHLAATGVTSLAALAVRLISRISCQSWNISQDDLTRAAVRNIAAQAGGRAIAATVLEKLFILNTEPEWRRAGLEALAKDGASVMSVAKHLLPLPTDVGSRAADVHDWAWLQACSHDTKAALAWREWSRHMEVVASSAAAGATLGVCLLAAVADGRALTPRAMAETGSLVSGSLATPQERVTLLQVVAADAKEAAMKAADADGAVKAHLVCMVGDLPFFDASDRAAAMQAGLQSMGAGTEVGGAGLARQTLRMAAHTDRLVDKYRVARLGMEQIELWTEHHGTPPQVEMLRILQRVADAEDGAVQVSPNRIWFHAASSLAMLERMQQPLRGQPNELAQIGLKMLETPWASSEYLVACGTELLNGMGKLAPSDAVIELMVDQARDAMQRASTPRQQLEALRQGLRQLSKVEASGIRKAFAEDVSAPTIDRSDGGLVINGVRLDRRDSVSEPAPSPSVSVTEPAVPEPIAPLLLSSYTASPLHLEDIPSTAVSQVRWDAAYGYGYVGVFNPLSGKIEQHYSHHSGVAGVYDPDSGTVLWKEQYKHSVAGAYNPRTREAEWQYGSMGAGLAAVFDVQEGCVKFHSAEYRHGTAGVLDPTTGRAYWYPRDEYAYKCGVAMIWDQKTEESQHKYSYNEGRMGVNTDPSCPTLSASSFGFSRE